MKHIFVALVLLAAAAWAPSTAVAQQQPIFCNQSTGAQCVTASNCLKIV